MKASKTLMAFTAALAVVGCSTSLGPDLSGLWVANSYEYRSGSGETVDIIERDGASFNLAVRRHFDGRRLVTASFDDGMGGRESMSGEADVDAGTFTIEAVVFDFTLRNRVLTLVSTSPRTFDFGDGAESATLTIRLTQL